MNKNKLAKFVALSLLIYLPLSITTHCRAAVKNESWESLAYKERKGVRYFKQQKYKKAFSNLKETAIRGYKQAQYFMAFMFLKGYEVEQNVILGMAWLGVAKESGIESWQQLYEKIYAAATPAQQKLIDQKTVEYIKMYGKKVQQVVCRNVIPAGQHRHQIQCSKTAGKYPLYPFELAPGKWIDEDGKEVSADDVEKGES